MTAAVTRMTTVSATVSPLSMAVRIASGESMMMMSKSRRTGRSLRLSNSSRLTLYALRRPSASMSIVSGRSCKRGRGSKRKKPISASSSISSRWAVSFSSLRSVPTEGGRQIPLLIEAQPRASCDRPGQSRHPGSGRQWIFHNHRFALADAWMYTINGRAVHVCETENSRPRLRMNVGMGAKGDATAPLLLRRTLKNKEIQ
jgi:hypothetical protein